MLSPTLLFSRPIPIALLLAALQLGALPAEAQEVKGPVRVTVETVKDERVEVELPVDPTPRLQYRNIGASFNLNIMDEMNRRLHLSHFPTFKLDGLVTAAGGVGGRFEATGAPLPKAGTRPRQGYMNIWVKDDIRITQMVELTATKNVGPDRKRRMEAVIVRYLIENKGKTPRKVGMRTTIDSFLVTVRQCKFAAPNRPGKLLEALEFKDARDMPPYVQVMQNADLKNPGLMAWVTFALGSGVEKPDRIVLTGNLGRRDLWELTPMAGGINSLIGFFWEPKEIRPGGKRELAYGYGTGQALPLNPDSHFSIDLGGSFEVGKTFTISALVSYPSEGQTLRLELPKGLERVEGKDIQPVPQTVGGVPESMVLWKGRVLEYGRYPIVIRSSGGVSKTTIVTVAPAGG